MAKSLSAGKAAVRLIAYSLSTKNVRASVTQLRKFSGYEDRDGPYGSPLPEDHAVSRSIVWPDETMGPLNTPDFRFALPGNIGVSTEKDPITSKERNTETESESGALPEGTPERHLTVVSQLIAESDYLDSEDGRDTVMADNILRKYFENARVELAIQDCPQLIYKDFASLFTDMPKSDKLTIITITQRTENDMSGWNPKVEEEREALLENFITTASEICHMLKAHNFWCDYIDPSSGQPYFGPYSNTTFYETDERYRHLGFEIEDLGCCKVIYHKKWATKVFVGSIFTMAPKEHKVVQDLLQILS